MHCQVIHIDAYVIEEKFIPQIFNISFKLGNINRWWESHNQISTKFQGDSCQNSHIRTVQVFHIDFNMVTLRGPFLFWDSTFGDHGLININYSKTFFLIIWKLFSSFWHTLFNFSTLFGCWNLGNFYLFLSNLVLFIDAGQGGGWYFSTRKQISKLSNTLIEGKSNLKL